MLLLVLVDLLGRFNDENGLGGILLDDLGNVPPSGGGAVEVGDVAEAFPALKDFRLNKVIKNGFFELVFIVVDDVVDVVGGLCVSRSVCDPS